MLKAASWKAEILKEVDCGDKYSKSEGFYLVFGLLYVPCFYVTVTVIACRDTAPLKRWARRFVPNMFRPCI